MVTTYQAPRCVEVHTNAHKSILPSATSQLCSMTSTLSHCSNYSLTIESRLNSWLTQTLLQFWSLFSRAEWALDIWQSCKPTQDRPTLFINSDVWKIYYPLFLFNCDKMSGCIKFLLLIYMFHSIVSHVNENSPHFKPSHDVVRRNKSKIEGEVLPVHYIKA
jgi:hypothetical protein